MFVSSWTKAGKLLLSPSSKRDYRSQVDVFFCLLLLVAVKQPSCKDKLDRDAAQLVVAFSVFRCIVIFFFHFPCA